MVQGNVLDGKGFSREAIIWFVVTTVPLTGLMVGSAWLVLCLCPKHLNKSSQSQASKTIKIHKAWKKVSNTKYLPLTVTPLYRRWLVSPVANELMKPPAPDPVLASLDTGRTGTPGRAEALVDLVQVPHGPFVGSAGHDLHLKPQQRNKWR